MLQIHLLKMLPIVKKYKNGYAFYCMNSKCRMSPITTLQELLEANMIGERSGNEEDPFYAISPYYIKNFNVSLEQVRATLASLPVDVRKRKVAEFGGRFYTPDIVMAAADSCKTCDTKLRERYLKLWAEIPLEQTFTFPAYTAKTTEAS